MDAARGLHLHVRADVLLEELDVLEFGTGRAEARRRLDDVGATIRHAVAGSDLLFFRQEARLDNDLQDAVTTEILDVRISFVT